MITQAVKTYRVMVADGKKEYVLLRDEKTKEFENSLQEGEVFTRTLQKGKEIKTSQQRKYLHGGVLKSFVPNYFDSIADAKDHFCRIHLFQEDVFGEDEIEELRISMSQAREVLSYKHLENGNIAVKWVKSTEHLTLSEAKGLIDYIMRQAAKNEIIILTPEEYFKKCNG